MMVDIIFLLGLPLFDLILSLYYKMFTARLIRRGNLRPQQAPAFYYRNHRLISSSSA